MTAHVRELCFCGLNLACSWKNRSKHGHGWPKVLGTLVVRVNIWAGQYDRQQNSEYAVIFGMLSSRARVDHFGQYPVDQAQSPSGRK